MPSVSTTLERFSEAGAAVGVHVAATHSGELVLAEARERITRYLATSSSYGTPDRQAIREAVEILGDRVDDVALEVVNRGGRPPKGLGKRAASLGVGPWGLEELTEVSGSGLIELLEVELVRDANVNDVTRHLLNAGTSTSVIMEAWAHAEAGIVDDALVARLKFGGRVTLGLIHEARVSDEAIEALVRKYPELIGAQSFTQRVSVDTLADLYEGAESDAQRWSIIDVVRRSTKWGDRLATCAEDWRTRLVPARTRESLYGCFSWLGDHVDLNDDEAFNSAKADPTFVVAWLTGTMKATVADTASLRRRLSEDQDVRDDSLDVLSQDRASEVLVALVESEPAWFAATVGRDEVVRAGLGRLRHYRFEKMGRAGQVLVGVAMRLVNEAINGYDESVQARVWEGLARRDGPLDDVIEKAVAAGED